MQQKQAFRKQSRSTEVAFSYPSPTQSISSGRRARPRKGGVSVRQRGAIGARAVWRQGMRRDDGGGGDGMAASPRVARATLFAFALRAAKRDASE